MLPDESERVSEAVSTCKRTLTQESFMTPYALIRKIAHHGHLEFASKQGFAGIKRTAATITIPIEQHTPHNNCHMKISPPETTIEHRTATQ